MRAGVLIGVLVAAAAMAAERPNIVVMLADDMGYGEVQQLNPERGKIKTPQLDAIARSGMVFTDAHSGSSVCTPTRYGLMTGRYAWRTRLQSGVLTGGSSLIARETETVAELLKKQGYHTAVIGKWHLGMLFDGKKNSSKNVPVGAKVTDGPIDAAGFDEFHGFHHARQMSFWIENDTVTRKLKPEEMLPDLTKAAVDYIARRKGKKQPFFLYVPWSSPHSPVVPTKEWQGKSGLNAHADFVMQTDDCFGQVMAALKANGMAENTLVICSSDNGTSHSTSNLQQLIKMGHHPSGELRGSKADLWDGGHRVPFLVSWPKVVKAGTTCDKLVCLTDLMATAADVVGVELAADEGVDSMSFLPALRGEETHRRETVIHHSIAGYFAIRQGPWKLMLCPDSGGWTNPRPNGKNWQKLREAGEPLVQLYEMNADLGEQKNLAATNPEKAASLKQLLVAQVEAGRTTPGPAQKNDAKIIIEKSPGGKGK